MAERKLFRRLFSKRIGYRERPVDQGTIGRQEVLTGVSPDSGGQLPFMRTEANTETALLKIGSVIASGEKDEEQRSETEQRQQRRKDLQDSIEASNLTLEAILAEAAADLFIKRHAEADIPPGGRFFTDESTTMNEDGTPEYPFVIQYKVKEHNGKREIVPATYSQTIYQADAEDWDSDLSPTNRRGPYLKYTFSSGKLNTAALRWDGDIFGTQQASRQEPEWAQNTELFRFLASGIQIPRGKYLNSYLLQVNLQDNERSTTGVEVKYLSYSPRKKASTMDGFARVVKDHVNSRTEHRTNYWFADDVNKFIGREEELEKKQFLGLLEGLNSFVPITDLHKK